MKKIKLFCRKGINFKKSVLYSSSTGKSVIKERLEMISEANEVLKEHEWIILSILKRYSYYKNQEDLYQVGQIGLLQALKHYDPTYQVKFSTFAYPYVQGEILKYIREDRSIKISKDMIKLNQSLEKAKEKLMQKLMREPSDEELSMILDIDLDKIHEARKAVEYVQSLDYCLSDEGREMTLYDSIKVDCLDLAPSVMDLKEELKKLPSEEQDLILNRYYQGLTQEETSKRLGISQVQVSRKEQKILTKLKSKLVS